MGKRESTQLRFITIRSLCLPFTSCAHQTNCTVVGWYHLACTRYHVIVIKWHPCNDEQSSERGKPRPSAPGRGMSRIRPCGPARTTIIREEENTRHDQIRSEAVVAQSQQHETRSGGQDVPHIECTPADRRRAHKLPCLVKCAYDKCYVRGYRGVLHICRFRVTL